MLGRTVSGRIAFDTDFPTTLSGWRQSDEPRMLLQAQRLSELLANRNGLIVHQLQQHDALGTGAWNEVDDLPCHARHMFDGWVCTVGIIQFDTGDGILLTGFAHTVGGVDFITVCHTLGEKFLHFLIVCGHSHWGDVGVESVRADAVDEIAFIFFRLACGLLLNFSGQTHHIVGIVRVEPFGEHFGQSDFDFRSCLRHCGFLLRMCGVD